MKQFYLNTTLPASELARARATLSSLNLDGLYTAEERAAQVAITAAGGRLFDTLREAEAAQRVVRRAAPTLFRQAVVAFVEVGTGELEVGIPLPEQQPVYPLKQPKTVLAAEDDPLIARWVTHVLRPLGVEVVLARNGREALEMAEDLEPDLIILDLMMPEMHGWEVVARMKANEVLKGIPIIILTALGTEQDRVFALTVAGVDAFLVKPVSMDTLRQHVWAVLTR